MRCLRYSKCVLLTVLLTVNILAQQITGSIRGTVSDPSNAVVQGAALPVVERLVENAVGRAHHPLGFARRVPSQADPRRKRRVCRAVTLQGSAPEISGFSSNRPNVVGDPNSGPRTPQQWFNKAAFQRITPDPNSPAQQFGNEGRNLVQGPAYANWDFSAVKNTRVTEGKELQFRGDLFNFLNHTNLRLPNSDISSPTFGEIHSDLGPRVIQVALKFLF